MSELVRWTFLAFGLVGTIVVLYLHVFAPQLLGVRRHRVENLAIGACSMVLVIGSWYRSPIAWYAAFAFCLYNVLEGTLRWRRLLGGSTATSPKIGMGIWLAFNGLLLLALFSFAGRSAFRMVVS
jgi:hypothetical protein